MKKINGLIGLLVLALFIFTNSACGPYKKTEIARSDILEEDAMVVDLVYTPSQHGSGVGAGPSIDMTGEGGLGIAIVSVSVDIPEKYAIVFKCQHGKFIIECNTPGRKELWQKLDEGQKVKVKYKEVYELVYLIYKDENKKKVKELVEKRLKKYDFLTAEPYEGEEG